MKDGTNVHQQKNKAWDSTLFNSKFFNYFFLIDNDGNILKETIFNEKLDDNLVKYGIFPSFIYS